MAWLFEFVQKQIETNQFFGGGLILMIAGGLVAYFREVPARIWSWLKHWWIIEVDVLDRDSAFLWIDEWLARHAYSRRRARVLTVRTQPVSYEERLNDPTGDARPRILFSPGPGEHYLFYRGRLVILNRQRPDMNSNAAQQAPSVRETFHISVFSRDRNIIRQLLEDARDVAAPNTDNRISIYRTQYSSWTESLKRLPRPAESVVLRDGLMQELIDDVKTFLARRTWYIDRGIPFRRGVLLYGPPGAGKSSAVLAIASALKMDIALLSLASSNLDDDDLCELLATPPANAIVLIEDIDCVFLQRKETDEKRNKLTFSGLLNAIDGVASGEGRVLIATTNHIERLDPALIRPGRIDRKDWIGHADRDQLRRMFVRFFSDCDPALADQFAEGLPNEALSMSAVQTFLVKHSDGPEAAIRHLDDLAQQATPAAESPEESLVELG